MNLKVIGKYVVIWGFAPKKTLWIDNIKDELQFRFRRDHLLSVSRLYSRELRTYTYELIIGRFYVSAERINKDRA